MAWILPKSKSNSTPPCCVTVRRWWGVAWETKILCRSFSRSGYCAGVLYGLLVNDVVQQMVGIDGGSQVVSVLELLVVGRHGKTHPVYHQVKPDFRLLVGSHLQLPVPSVEDLCRGKEELLISGTDEELRLLK